MIMPFLSYRFRLYPNRAIEDRLSLNLEVCRWLYNRLLELKNEAEKEKQRLGRKGLQLLIVDLKGEYPELNLVYSKVLQMVNNQLHYTLKVLAEKKNNGRKVGNLRFKGEGQFKTLNFSQKGFKLDYERRKLHLSKIGDIPIRLHRTTASGKIKEVIVKREKTGKWFAIAQVEERTPHLLPPCNEKAVGIDVGVKFFLTDSEDRQVENPQYYQRALNKIRVLQRSISRKKNSSSNRRKAVLKLNYVYEKLTSQMNDFLHKLSTYYARNYRVNVVENLIIANMTRNRSLDKRILDASRGKFFKMLSYKAERAGRLLLKVDPAYTTQENEEVIHDRDLRGSINILNRGLSRLGRPCVPVGARPLRFVPASLVVETGSLDLLDKGSSH